MKKCTIIMVMNKTEHTPKKNDAMTYSKATPLGSYVDMLGEAAATLGRVKYIAWHRARGSSVDVLSFWQCPELGEVRMI